MLKKLLVAAHYKAKGVAVQLVPASAKMLPSFMVIGAQKAGTTSMFDYLVSHPQVLEPWFKEMDFFNRRRMFEAKSSYLLDDYRSLFPRSRKAKNLAKKIGRPVITGEASQYMSFEDAPARIKELLPNIKFIVLLRDPVSRAYSHYYMRRRYGWEKDSFLEAFYREDVADGMSGGSSYRYRGLYAIHLQWWFKEFSRENFLIMESKDVRAQGQKAYDQVCDFLDIEHYRPPEQIESNVGHYEKPDEESLKVWKEFYRPYNENLFELVGRDYGWNN